MRLSLSSYTERRNPRACGLPQRRMLLGPNRRAWPCAASPVICYLRVVERVCGLRKTDEAIEVALKSLRRQASDKCKRLKPETLRFARYVILFTTNPPDRSPVATVLEWNRLRWQVELVFKRFKSLAQLGHVPKHDVETAKAWLYGKLLVAPPVENLVRHALTVSPWGPQWHSLS